MKKEGLVPSLKLEQCINELCPWSGKPVSEDSLTRYRDKVVGFCNTGCRDKFELATSQFDDIINNLAK